MPDHRIRSRVETAGTQVRSGERRVPLLSSRLIESGKNDCPNAVMIRLDRVIGSRATGPDQPCSPKVANLL